MKKHKAILWTLGIASTIVVPTFITISCADNVTAPQKLAPPTNNDQIKMDGITRSMITIAINNKLDPQVTKGLPSNKPLDWTTTINGLVGVNIHVDSWVADDEGSVTMNALAWKLGFISSIPFDDIAVKGYAINNQQKMDGITQKMVNDDIVSKIKPTLKELPPAVVPGKWVTSLNYLDEITLEIRSWSVKNDGSITMNVRLTAPAISEHTFTGVTITGYKSSDQAKMDEISQKMVENAVIQKIGVGRGQLAPAKPNDWKTNLGGISKVGINVFGWIARDDGTIGMSVAISKDKLKPPSPFTVRVSGYKTNNQQKMDKITEKMVYDAINAELKPNDATAAPATTPADFHANIGELQDVNVHLTKWAPVEGIVDMTATISKLGLPTNRVFNNITITGYKTSNQVKFDAITKAQVQQEIKKRVGPDPTKRPETTTPPDWRTAFGALQDVNIHITKWLFNPKDGTVTTDASLTKTNLTPPSPFTDMKITGYKTDDQQKMDGISVDEIKTAIITHLQPTTEELAPASTPGTWTYTLNNLEGVTITLSSWTPSTDGSVSMSVTLSKTGLTSPTAVLISITGYKTRETYNFEKISSSDVHDAIKAVLDPTVQKTVPTVAPTGGIVAILNTVTGVTINIAGWSNNNDGSVTMDATISKQGMPVHTPFTGIIVRGYKTTDLANFEAINKQQVTSEILNKLGTPSGSIPANPNSWALDHAINNVDGTTLTIDKWTPDVAAGNLSIDATISKGTSYTALKFTSIDIKGYTAINFDKIAFDSITKDDVTGAIRNNIGPQLINNVPAVSPGSFTVQLRTLTRVNVLMTSWRPGSDGSVTMGATISNGGFADRTFSDIKITGFGHILKTTATHVSIPLLDIVGNGVSHRIDDTHYLVGTVNRLMGVTMGTGNNAGKIIKAIQLGGKNQIKDMSNGFIQEVRDGHYLIGTTLGELYQMTIDINVPRWTTQIDQVENRKMPSVKNGWCQKVDDYHYLINTENHGIYQVKTGTGATEGHIIHTEQSKLILHTGPRSWIHRINETHYVVGDDRGHLTDIKLGLGNLAGIIMGFKRISGTVIPSVIGGWAQTIDSTHYWIGTQNDGIYVVETRNNGETWHIQPLVGDNIPNVGGGFSQRINATHYLVGGVNGMFMLETSSPKALKSTTPILRDTVGDAKGAWVQKIGPATTDSDNYLVGSYSHGLFEVSFSYFA